MSLPRYRTIRFTLSVTLWVLPVSLFAESVLQPAERVGWLTLPHDTA